MLNVKEKPELVDGKALKPIERYGLKTMSIGYIVNEDTPMIWRGPMVSSALEQMLRDVEWGELDVLVVDMPPGTGDAQLTLAQRVALTGAVIVSTPQDIALVDARKGLNMFRKVAVPVLGFVENMSFLPLPALRRALRDLRPWRGARGGGEARRAVPGRGALASRHPHDVGLGAIPIVVAQPDSPHAQIYKNIAGRVWKQLTANQRGAARGAEDRGAVVPGRTRCSRISSSPRFTTTSTAGTSATTSTSAWRTLKSGAHVLDLGCGTGLLACRIAEEGFAVTGVDPAEGMLRVARARRVPSGSPGSRARARPCDCRSASTSST